MSDTGMVISFTPLFIIGLIMLLKPLLKKIQSSPLPLFRPVSSKNSFDDLTQLKELLDSGIISQEEFDSKKDEILKNI